MARTVERMGPATYDDLGRLPEHLVGELIGRDLH
jgi:hypothetical protein